MNRIILIALFLFSVTSNAQTKKESEDWLVYYLNKYFDSDWNSITERSYLREGKPYIYRSRKFMINSGKLIITATENKKTDSNIVKSVLISQKRTIIDLSRVTKVTQESSLTTPNSYRFYWVKIFLEFSNTDFNNLSVREFDELNNRDLTGKSYVKLFQLTSDNYDNENVVKDNFPNRLLKAFEKVAELNGAQQIKEVF